MVWKIVAYELKHTPVLKHVFSLFCLTVTAFIASEFLEVIDFSQARQPVMLDILFFFFLSVPLLIVREKSFSLQHVKDTFYVNTFYLLLKQTPLSSAVICKSRFLSSAIYTLLFNSYLIAMFFFFSETLRETLTIREFILLGLNWVIISYIWGAFVAAADAGYKFKNCFTFVVWSIVYFFAFIAVMTLFNLSFGAPFVVWSIETVQVNPLLLFALSALVTAVVTIFCLFEYKRYEKRNDYFL